MSQYLVFIRLLILRCMPTPKWRVRYLRILGSKIGRNNRIHSIEFLNAQYGFGKLKIANDCYIGPGTLIDLAGGVEIEDGAVISAKTIILSHDDPGSSHKSPLCNHFPPTLRKTHIGKYCWIGAGAIILSGTHIGDESVLGAGSVAKGVLDSRSVYAGQPATLKRTLVG